MLMATVYHSEMCSASTHMLCGCVAVLLQLLYANYVTWQLSVTVHIASEMRFNALHGLTQPCLTA